MSVQRTLIVLTALTIGLPAGATYLRANQAVTEAVMEQQEIQSRQLATVRRADVRSSLSALGSLQPASAVDVSLRASGQVVEVLVETGDYVYAGQPLLRLDDTTTQINYEQAQLNLERATVTLEDLLGPVDQNDIRVAEANVNSARGQYTAIANGVSNDDLQAAQLRYEQAWNAYLESERARRVSGNLDEEEVALLDARLGELSFNAEIARLQLDTLQGSNQSNLYEASARITQAQRQLEQVMAGPTQAQVDNAQIAVQRAEAALRDAETALNRTTLVSPVDGVVTVMDARVGQMVSAGTAPVEVTDTAYYRLLASVDETDVPSIEVGQAAYVRLDALPNIDLPAHIAHIDILGAETNNVVSYTAEVVLDTQDPRVRMGMTGEAFLVTEESDDTLVVPNAYVQIDPSTGATVVQVLRADGTLATVEVTTGLRGEDDTEILMGLREGDVVVMQG